MRLLCRHCHNNAANRPRQMCWSCYYTPGIRERYPSTSKFANRGVGGGDFDGPAPLPEQPTPHSPASPGKMAVLEERARQGVALWHPKDYRER